MSRILNFDDYKVVLIAPLIVEAQAAWHMLDEEHDGEFPTSQGDDYMYLAGEINGHNVAIATLPSGGVYGIGSAAALAAQVKNTFRKLWIGLLVGVAAGLPDLSGTPPRRDIRLGDVLVGLGDGDNAGLVSYGLGKDTKEGFKPLKWAVQAKTESIVRAAIGKMRIRATTRPHAFLQHYGRIKGKPHDDGVFEDPGQAKDVLYETIVDKGERSQAVPREPRPPEARTRIWYGHIGSGDRLMKNAVERDKLRDTFDLIGLEMEAAGTMNSINVAVIRGVCNYGDEHKNNEWRPYAAAMAAMYARAILYSIPPDSASKGARKPRAEEVSGAAKVEDDAAKAKTDEQHVVSISTSPAIVAALTFMTTLPRYNNQMFSSKEAELVQICRMLENPFDCSHGVCLDGLGGIGKSEIAFEYARRCLDERSVFWFKADSIESVESGYRAIASKINPEFCPETETQDALFRMVKDRLEMHGSLPWLLALDDADDRDLLDRDLERGKSLLADGKIVSAANSLRIEPMCIKDCHALFRKVQAASYIREKNTTVDEFIDLYRNIESHNDLFRRTATAIEQKQESVLLTWEISYLKIARSASPAGKSNPAKLLDLLGFIDSQPSPLRTLSEAEFEFEFKDRIGETPIHSVEFSCGKQETPSVFLRTTFDNRFTSRSDNHLRRAISSLQNYSLIASRDCWVHPVVHSWISRRLSYEDKCKYIKWISEELLRGVFLPENCPEDRWDYFLLPPQFNNIAMNELPPLRHTRVLLSYTHLEPIMRYMTGEKETALGFADLLYRIGLTIAQMGKIQEGVDYLEKAITIMADSIQPMLLQESVPSAQATLWLAQCLHKCQSLTSALHFESIRETFPTDSKANFETQKELLAATIGVVQVLTDMRQPNNNFKIRELVDKSLIPLFNSMPFCHMLRTIVLPEILLYRVEAAEDVEDRNLAIRNIVRYYETDLGEVATGGQPHEWLVLIGQLRGRKKWSLIKEVANTFLEHQNLGSITHQTTRGNNSEHVIKQHEIKLVKLHLKSAIRCFALSSKQTPLKIHFIIVYRLPQLLRYTRYLCVRKLCFPRPTPPNYRTLQGFAIPE
ncbi:hypothetical protein G7Y89_g4101 [Cudoniella acicularis]|uniref:Nucleoside phosphorylase domain-containing protein n=1 Tax=Cudoniella acicularis TaxID=354080 RepID=A0A8H4RS78_9HELO|nr:hypothetical protein G7Y89_g4101 [Cudoniella acicularis]